MDGHRLLLLALFACGGDDEPSGALSIHVGAACALDEDCAEGSVCLVHGDFGSGMCSRACTSHDDCPAQSACVQVGTGMCVVACAADEDCADYPHDWVCGEEDAAGGGPSQVCRIP